MTESPVSKWTIRPRFVIGLLALFWLGWYFLAVDARGGRFQESPDGKFIASVMRNLNGKGPYDFDIRYLKTGQVFSRFSIQPVGGKPRQQVRGASEIFEWSEDSSQLKIKLDDHLWGTIVVDEPEK
ncbi:hypothetical protein [Planctomicrobium piriforme]|uniref:Uncharacterized protein n=1 Tax=Planctomicrobium piriforme TaxID=1576369 RepID=A0A1I3MR57_9PLAN|nr:hypothetical protein [Planctomicrobium piriforme]SFI99508.1 hypothetical protein SAMN05421753_11484 [Planctomicrobium piriforme]